MVTLGSEVHFLFHKEREGVKDGQGIKQHGNFIVCCLTLFLPSLSCNKSPCTFVQGEARIWSKGILVSFRTSVEWTLFSFHHDRLSRFLESNGKYGPVWLSKLILEHIIFFHSWKLLSGHCLPPVRLPPTLVSIDIGQGQHKVAETCFYHTADLYFPGSFLEMETWQRLLNTVRKEVTSRPRKKSWKYSGSVTCWGKVKSYHSTVTAPITWLPIVDILKSDQGLMIDLSLDGEEVIRKII